MAFRFHPPVNHLRLVTFPGEEIPAHSGIGHAVILNLEQVPWAVSFTSSQRTWTCTRENREWSQHHSDERLTAHLHKQLSIIGRYLALK
jgi:hypothetical protein